MGIIVVLIHDNTIIVNICNHCCMLGSSAPASGPRLHLDNVTRICRLNQILQRSHGRIRAWRIRDKTNFIEIAGSRQ